MTEQVFLFGKVLEIDEALKNDIKLRVHMMEIGSQLRIKIQKMFSSINELYDFLGIREAAVEMVYTFLYRSGIDYLHNQGITNFNYEDIELTSKWFLEKYEDLVVELVDYRVENEEVVVSRGLSGTRKEHELKKLERKSILKIQEEFMDMGFMDAMELIGMIEIVINNANIPITPITVEDEDKGVALFKELKKMEGTEAYEIAFQLFQIDPTEVEYYEYCMLEFPEETDNLLHLQQITGLALQKSILEKALKKMFEKMPHNTEEETLIIKNKLENIQKEVDISNNKIALQKSILEKALKKMFEKMPHNTEEETLIIKNKLENIQKEVDISNNKIVKKVDQLLYDFDIQERTFCNILFDTREMKRAAEKDFDKLDTICGNLESMSEAECEKKKQLISEEETVIEIKQLFLEKIDNRIKRIWIEEDSEKIIDIFTHTEKKKQLISEEETVIEIKQLFLEKIDNRIKRIWIEEDSEKIIDIFTHTNIYEKSSILQSIKAINDIGRTDDKKRYIDALNGITNDTLCIIRAYKEWENKKTLRKYGLLIVLLALGVCLIPFGIGIIVVLVGAILMKKTWNLLTLNGEVIHPQMLVDDIKEENTVKEIVEVKSGEAEKIEIEKAEVASRTVRGVVYESLEKADLARKEHGEIDQLKKELLKTKSQKKRRKIVGDFSEKLQVKDAIKRYDLLLAKVSEKTPISEKIRISYGITVLLTFVLAVFLLMLEPAASSFTVICGVWSGFGVWICAIWKIVQVIRSRNKNYYKNIILLMLEPAASSFTVICGVWSGFGVWICAIWKIVQVIRSRNKNYYKNIKYI